MVVRERDEGRVPLHRLRESPEHEREDASVPVVLVLARRIEADGRLELLFVRANRHQARVVPVEAGDGEFLTAGQTE